MRKHAHDTRVVACWFRDLRWLLVTALATFASAQDGHIAPIPTGSSGSTPAGVALARTVRSYVGDAAAVTAIRSVRTTARRTITVPNGTMEGIVTVALEYPGTLRTHMRLPTGEIKQVLTPTTAAVTTATGERTMTSAEHDATSATLQLDLITILKNLTSPAYAFTEGPTEDVDGTPARTLSIAVAGATERWWIHPSGRLLRSARTTTAGTLITEYGGWQRFGRLMLPTTRILTREGALLMTETLTDVEIAPDLGALLAAAPSSPPVAAPPPAPPQNVCKTNECGITVRIIKANGLPCAYCPVTFWWTPEGLGTGSGEGTLTTDHRGYVHFRTPVRTLDMIGTIVNRKGDVLPLRFNVDTLGGTRITIDTTYIGE